MLNKKSKLSIGMGMLCLLITQSMAYSLDSSKTMDKQSNQNVNHQRVLVSSALHYNGNGNMSTDNKGASFSYNAANALTQVSLASGAKESEYYYANGLRAVAQSNTQVLVHYYSRHNQLLNTSDGAQQSSAYLIANNVNARSVNGDATVLLHNRHGSVIGQLGDKSQFYQYSVYGVQRTEDGGRRTDSGSGILDLAINPLRYSGYMFDPLTGLYYLKARDYDPNLRSFIQVDSYAFNNYGLINGYYYSNNNSVMGVDSSGHVALPDIPWEEVHSYVQDSKLDDLRSKGVKLGGGQYGVAYKVSIMGESGETTFVFKYLSISGEGQRNPKDLNESIMERHARVLNSTNQYLNGDNNFASFATTKDGVDLQLTKYIDPNITKKQTDPEEVVEKLKDYTHCLVDCASPGNFFKLTTGELYVVDADQLIMRPPYDEELASPYSSQTGKNIENSFSILLSGADEIPANVHDFFKDKPHLIEGKKESTLMFGNDSTSSDSSVSGYFSFDLDVEALECESSSDEG
ncbi:RHS repeat-associated core domain-containing protein [Cysteiniphilum halobium]|uniref:RHS repeat-associated core domain-containing protein n=1 Tax=Cysteiniphilum halobium TaxID=2219059 RepID=UPI0013C2E3D0|nr:RHS repeat-associated core domain-containing protein [Cysteiniphilum halobium]